MDTPRPKIGSFKSPEGNAPRPATPSPLPPPVPEASVLETTPPNVDGFPTEITDEERKILEKEAAQEAAEAKLTPIERYQKRLKIADIPIEEARTIYDAVLTKDYYEEFVSLAKGPRAVFRTRRYDDVLRLQTALESKKPTLILTQEDLVTRYNLAASLFEWKGVKLAHESEEDLEKVFKLILRMPAPVYHLLGQALAKFDWKIGLIFSDGAAENFS